MPASLEFKAKNVDRAVEKASTELRVPKNEIKYEVLSYGSSGIFGLSGAKKAKIRVTLPEDLLVKEPQEETVEFGDGAPQEIDDSVEIGRLVLQRILETLSAEAKISVKAETDRLCFNVNGGNAGILIGKRGQTLDAIQTIVEKVVNKRNNHRIRVLVDIEGYLETRKENLESMAFRLAEKAKKIGKPISLGQMNAYDRRIVHIALKDFPGVLTRSRGDGPLRKLVIFPKKRGSSRR